MQHIRYTNLLWQPLKYWKGYYWILIENVSGQRYALSFYLRGKTLSGNAYLSEGALEDKVVPISGTVSIRNKHLRISVAYLDIRLKFTIVDSCADMSGNVLLGTAFKEGSKVGAFGKAVLFRGGRTSKDQRKLTVGFSNGITSLSWAKVPKQSSAAQEYLHRHTNLLRSQQALERQY